MQLRGLSTTFLANLVQTTSALGLQLVVFAVTARGLGAGAFGAYSIVLATAAIGVELAGIGSADILVRSVARDRSQIAMQLGTMLRLLEISLPMVVVVLAVFERLVDTSQLSFWLVLLGLAAEITVGRVSASCELVMIAHKHVIAAGWVRIGTALSRLAAASVYFVILGHSALAGWLWFVAVQAALYSAILVGVLIKIYGRPIMQFSLANLRDGIPFCVNQTTRAAQGNMDRLVLSHYSDAVSLGVYSAATRVLQVGLFPIQILTRITYPQFFVEGAKGAEAAAKYALRVLPAYLLVGGVAALGVVLAATLLPSILGHEFRNTVWMAKLLAISMPIIALQYPAADALTGAGRQSTRAAIYVCSAVLFGIVLVIGAHLAGPFGMVVAFNIGHLTLCLALWGKVFLVPQPRCSSQPVGKTG